MSMLLSAPRFCLTVQQAATRHGLTVQQLNLAIRQRRLRVLRVGRQVWVSKAELATYLRHRDVGA